VGCRRREEKNVGSGEIVEVRMVEEN